MTQQLTNRLAVWWDSFCIFHSWSKWKQYEEIGRAYPGLLGKGIPKEGIPYSDSRQRRTCDCCGKMQDELVKGRNQ